MMMTVACPQRSWSAALIFGKLPTASLRTKIYLYISVLSLSLYIYIYIYMFVEYIHTFRISWGLTQKLTFNLTGWNS